MWDAQVCEAHGPFDVIIDDGGHTAQMINVAAELLFPDGTCLNNVSGAAVYVVEDLLVMTRCGERLG